MSFYTPPDRRRQVFPAVIFSPRGFYGIGVSSADKDKDKMATS